MTGALFEPLQICAMQVPNRIAMAPHSTHYADRLETERLRDYYLARAVGGVGLIVHEPVVVHPSSVSRTGKIWGFDEQNAEAYRTTTDAVHEAGARIVCQLIHNGKVDGHSSYMPAWFPSEAPVPGSAGFTHAMTVDEVREIIDAFVAAAVICRDGGFDGVEVHAAHGYLLQSFLSPATNARDDEYGGSAGNRLRIVREILQAMRARVGADFVIGVRWPADEFDQAGLSVDDSLELARTIADEVDYFSIVSGNLRSYERIVPDMTLPAGLNVQLAGRFRAALGGVPILVTGRIASPAEAARVVETGQADLVGLARALIADPEWVNKAREQRDATIRPCVYANDCRESIGARRSMTCMVNPDNGDPQVPWPVGGRTSVPGGDVSGAGVSAGVSGGSAGRVVVVGGGVAGLEAACTAARAGRSVVLFESGTELGGQVLLASRPEIRRRMGEIVAFLAAEAARLGVDVRLGVTATREQVLAESPALLVLAAGARARASRWGDRVGSTWNVLAGSAGKVLVGQAAGGQAGVGQEAGGTPSAAVVVDELGAAAWTSLAAVVALAEAGSSVSYVTANPSWLAGVESGTWPNLRRYLLGAGVRMYAHSGAELTETGVRVTSLVNGGVTDLTGAVFVDAGREPVRPAWDLSDVLPASTIGDVLAPRTIATAIREGRHAIPVAGG